jgi:capsular exopolysaccharide synthesis family protein
LGSGIVGLAIPETTSTEETAAIVSQQDASPGFQEALRSLAASILLSHAERPPRKIVVTSSVPQEGKTFLIGHLGITFAQSGASTVMVECDLRKPRLADRFGKGNQGGLSLFLSGGAFPDVVETDVENLNIICAGPKPPNPMALLGSKRMSDFLKVLSEKFQFVLIDTPPVLTVSDARILASRADGLILVVRAGETPRHLIERASYQIKSSGGNLLGTALTQVKAGTSGYGFYGRYYADQSYYTDQMKPQWVQPE